MKSKQLSVLILFSYLAPWFYAVLSQFWGGQGGASTTLNYFEFPLIILFSLILSFNPEKTKIISKFTFAPPLTILGVYILYDIFYSYLLRSPRVSDFQNVLSLYSVSPLLFLAFITTLLAVSLPTILSFLCWNATVSSRRRTLTLLCKGVALSVVVFAISSEAAYAYQKTRLYFTDWATAGNVKKNGRITSFLYHYNKRQDILATIGKHSHLPLFSRFYKKTPARKRNIHIVILESFVDPRQIKNFSYDQSPVSEKLLPFLVNGREFSIIKTPVYGGGTAQSEFEVLTGIPALAQIDSIEFNLFEGTATSSFVAILNKNGYQTIASVATEPVFYNAKLAYKGIGFDEIHFLGENSYFEEQEDHYLFDGDFLEANLSYIQPYLSQEEEGRPLLNYIVGMFGHIPFERNRALRPDVIAIHPDNELLRDMANQFYYRTEALAEYLLHLQQLDPDSIVLVTSDHLPPIFHNKDIIYKHDLKMNIALLLNNFSAVDISDHNVYELCHVIWNLLNESADPLATQSLFADVSKEEFYYSYIMEAMGLRTPAE